MYKQRQMVLNYRNGKIKAKIRRTQVDGLFSTCD